MRFVVLTLSLFTTTAYAQFGTGIAPGGACPGQYAPSNQAVNGNSDLMNMTGQLAARNDRIARLKDQTKIYNGEIDRARDAMGEVLTNQGIAAIREHRERRNGYGSYRKTCGGGHGGVAAGPATDPELFSTSPVSRPIDPNQTQVAPPDCFCVTNPASGAREDIWDKFVEDEGTVSDRVCDFHIAGVTHSSDRHAQEDCHDGMHDYYRAMEKKAELDEEIARLDDEARVYERQLRRVRDEITEGTYCPWCEAQRRGYSNQGAGNAVMQQGGILQALAASMGGGQGPQPYGYGAPPPPAMLPYGGAGYPVRPYAAPVPGYYGMTGPSPGLMNYGAVPGGIGPGAFGCQGTGLNQQLPIFGQQSPFNNPYANPAMAPMFNQGAGPGWGFPQYANGVPGFNQPGVFGQPSPYGQFGLPNQYGMTSPYGLGGPPGILPFQQNQFGSPYGYGSPYGISPFRPPNIISAGGLPYGLPLMGPGYGSPYGGGYGSPYGSPYGLGSPYGVGGFGSPYGGVPNYGGYGGTSFGGSYSGPNGSFFGQVNLLGSGTQFMQSSPYFGGGVPAPMPYYGSPTPIYNMAPRPGPPSILPYQ